MTPQRTDKPLDIYLRISLDKENDEEGVERQERDCRREAKRRGITVGKVITDNDTSATSGKPMPGRLELYKRMEDGLSGGVIVYHVERLLRKVKDMEKLIDLVEKTGARIVTIKSSELDLSTASGRVVARIFAAIGEGEVDKIKERMRSHFEDRAMRGISNVLGRRPFGWNDDKRTLHKAEAKLYKDLFDLVIAGRSLSWIAREWERRGILNVKGERYSVSSLRARIASPRAVGLATYKGDLTGAKGDWKPIISEDVQQAALDALRGRQQRQLRMTGEKRSPRLLSSLIACGAPDCDRVMRLVRSGNAVNYKCDSPGHGQIICELAEEEVEKRFLSILRNPKTHAALEKLRRRQPDTAKIVDDIQRAQATLDGADADLGAERINRKRWLTITDAANERLEGAKTRLHAAGDNPALLMASPDLIARTWDSLDLDAKRLYLSPWISAVRIAPLNYTPPDARAKTQKCSRCKEERPMTAFSPSQRGRRGTWCKDCIAAHKRGEPAPHPPTVRFDPERVTVEWRV